MIKKLKLESPGYPSLVTLFRYGEIDASVFYIDMELCAGSLEDFMADRRRSGVSIAIDEILSIMTQIANGLFYIHAEKEVHRDLKPRNGIELVF